MELTLQFILSVLALVATGAASWASVRQEAKQARKDVERLRSEMANMLDTTHRAIDAVNEVATESLRSTKRSHERIDAVMKAEAELEKSFARMDGQWQQWARTTQRLRLGENTP